MTQNEYKVGDRVMFKEDGNLHVITDINKEGLYRVSGSCGWFGARYLEPYDRKTAFLTRLQSLLREYDAFFVAHKTDMPVSVYFNDNEDNVPFASIGKEINKGCGVVVTADNVMDFDKE